MPKLGPARFHHRFEPPARPFCAYCKLCASARKPLLWGLLLQYPSEILSPPGVAAPSKLRQRNQQMPGERPPRLARVEGSQVRESIHEPAGGRLPVVGGFSRCVGITPPNQEGPRERGAFSNQESHRPATHQRMWVRKVLAGGLA